MTSPAAVFTILFAVLFEATSGEWKSVCYSWRVFVCPLETTLYARFSVYFGDLTRLKLFSSFIWGRFFDALFLSDSLSTSYIHDETEKELFMETLRESKMYWYLEFYEKLTSCFTETDIDTSQHNGKQKGKPTLTQAHLMLCTGKQMCESLLSHNLCIKVDVCLICLLRNRYAINVWEYIYQRKICINWIRLVLG